jgi:hypothetical protein
MLKSIIVFGGAIFSIFNLLPIPWTLRLTWMKFLYFIIVKSKEGITVNQVKQAVEKAETKAIRQEQLGIFIAQEILDPLTSEQIIKESLQSTRY